MNGVLKIETPKEAARRLAAGAIRDGFKPDDLHFYHNADGSPAFYRIRCKRDNGDKWIRPFHRSGERFVVGLPSAPANGRTLYRPRYPLIETDPVLIVEGEQKADRLAALGMTATTAGGATSACGFDWGSLRGRHCLIWRDNDKAGRSYSDEVAAILSTLGCTVELIDVEALGLPDTGDVVDWLVRHPQSTAADVLALPVTKVERNRKATDLVNDVPRVILTRGSDVQPVAVDWIWQGHLAAGKFHLIGGAPGTGKTTIAAALAATVTSGGRWPDGSCAERGSVVFWSGEDDNADTLNPRLRAAGADMSRVLTVDGMQEAGERFPFDPARDMDALRVALATVPDVRLIVIDPVVSAVSGDSHKNAEVRRGLQPLVDLAGEFRCALLGVTHFSKGTSGRDPVERITGSLAFGALARLVMVTAKQEADGERPERRVMLRAKSNIGPDGGGFVYDLQQGELPGYPSLSASCVLWGESIQGTARELLAEAEQHDDGHGSDAGSFLRDLLAYGPRTAKEIKSEAANAGYSMDAMHRAKRKIGAEAGKSSMTGGWIWRMPVAEDRAEGCEGGAQNCPPSSPSSEQLPPPSGFEHEVIRL